ncbi:cobalamin biosynthesis protein CbiX [Maribacter polysiphoniae]|uniref:Cobalamin biosynthesis protein CbiX n=1 Tax=Maribacter polysiphoniae TaxID=429344 RepID=A0A316E6J7_9FLAO|nr:CbiX/SirB N-terminal domain-containing protein [Maribacter polysiphoniae]MBD1260523.1 cobalamin biosynthesis protein CbiX [Maribacter polysiphoniae]PWK24353.1 sirohydrochlorin ferrochelatase [Maribacter polysiphoniae]
MKKSSSFLLLCAIIILTSCGQGNNKEEAKNQSPDKKIGVLLVNHGSVAKSWRQMLLDVEEDVKETILSNPKISKVTTAFMEYTEPSIATQMKEFDKEGFDEVIVVPIFLTVSSHYSHDIPVILGISSDPKAKEYLNGKEKIEVYKAKARVSVTPPLDYSTLLKKNVERRVKALSENPENEGVLLVAYGDAQYNQQWEEMVDSIGKYLKIKSGHDSIAYAWCGHLVSYSTEPTIKGIEKLMQLEDRVIVVPILVANDPYFQNDIIQKAVDAVEGEVAYKQDAILPDSNLNKWVIDITNKTVESL